MEDLLPFLIVLLISIVGAVFSKKRKRNVDENIAEQPHLHRNDDLLDWFDKLKIGGEEEHIPYLTPEKLTEPVKVEKENVSSKGVIRTAATIPGIFDKYSGFITPQERENMMSKEGIPMIKVDHITEGDLTKQSINSKLDEVKRPRIELEMRKAVVFSEIYNRKYT